MLQFPQEEPDYNVALSVSMVVFGFDGVELKILLARSTRPPFQGALFLPSRYIKANEELLLSAKKMFLDLFGYDNPSTVEQLIARLAKCFVTQVDASSTSHTTHWCTPTISKQSSGNSMACIGCR